MPKRKQQSPDVISAIFAATPDANTRTAMVFGSGLESQWSDTASNPSGAVGPYQILLPVHPNITEKQAEDPVYATNFMLPAYQQAVTQVSEQLWISNPELAAEQAAIIAEQPGGSFPQSTPGPYGQESTAAVNQTWSEASGLLSSKGVGSHPGNDYYVNTFDGSIQRGYMAAQIRFAGRPIAGPFDWAQAVQVANESNLNKDVIGPAKFAYDQGRIASAIATLNGPAFANAVSAAWNNAPAGWKSGAIKVIMLLFGGIVILIGLSHTFNLHPTRIVRKAAGTVTEAAGAVTGQPEAVAAGKAAKASGAHRET